MSVPAVKRAAASGGRAPNAVKRIDGKLPSSPFLRRAIDWALDFNEAELIRDHRRFRKQHPRDTVEHLARRLIVETSWKSAGVGAAAGLPGNPITAVPASVADVLFCMSMEARMVARIGLLFDERYFAAPNARYEVLIPMLGQGFGEMFLKRIGRTDATRVASSGVRELLTHESLSELKQSALGYVLALIAEQAVVSHSLPIIGGAIGGSWNFVQTRVVGWRAYKYFSRGGLSQVRAAARLKPAPAV